MKRLKKEYIILALILFATFIFRFPSLFEPFWYGDEGIFAAVANNLNQGGVLYKDAWDNKPPMIYLTYQAIFKIFGVSIFHLRLMTIIVVLTSAVVIYEIAKKTFDEKRALAATFIFGFLTSLRIVEGNLALTEIFMILPISAAMLLVIWRKFDYLSLFLAGILFAIASLYKQVGALEAMALSIFLFLGTPKFAQFVRRGLVLAGGFTVPFLPVFAYFAAKNLVGEYIFAAYTYYQIYLGESPRYQILINVLKFLPILAAVIYGLWKKRTYGVILSASEGSRDSSPRSSGAQNDSAAVGVFHLFLLWAAFAFLGSHFSGRTYGHYLVQATPAVALLLASLDWRPQVTRVRLIFAISFILPLVFLTKLLFTDFISGGPLNQIKYWRNFLEFANGQKGADSYHDFFDRNINSIMAVSDFLAVHDALGSRTYIWGDWPWLYAIADLQNPSRYVTSFHVFGVPNGRAEVIGDLAENPPDYIIFPPSSIGYFAELEKLLDAEYTLNSKVEGVEIFVKKAEDL